MGIGKRYDDFISKDINYRNRKANNDIANESSKKLEFIPEEPKYNIDDLIVSEKVKSKLLDVAHYTENSYVVFKKWGLDKTHKNSKRLGINFFGPPGTGKTMAAHAIAKYLGRKILVINYADIESKYVGDTPKNIRNAFEAARETNSIIFFDEADAILSRRVTNMNNATDVSVNQTRSVMLLLLNDYQDFVIFATNFIENFDPAFMRRISLHVEFDLPDELCREKLWKRYIPDELPLDINYVEIAKKYSGISGSDISTAVLNCAFKAAREKKSYIEKVELYSIVEDIINSKLANSKNDVVVTKRFVSDEYVASQVATK